MRIHEMRTAIKSCIMNNWRVRANGGSKDNLVHPYAESGVGQGKTTSVRSLVTDPDLLSLAYELFNYDKDRLGFINFSLAQLDVNEYAGWLVPAKDGESMRRLRPMFVPTEGCGIIFADEVAQANQVLHNLFGQAVDEHRVGDFIIPDGWVIVSAGNPLSARAGSNKLPSQLADRFDFLNLEVNTDDVLSYYASNNVDHRITSWIKFDDQHLHNFDVSATGNATPRSCQRAGVFLNMGLDHSTLRGMLNGQIGETASASLMAHIKLYEKLPDFDSIVKDPSTTQIPEDRGVLFALCGSLASKMNMTNCASILTYIQRIPEQEFMAFMLKDAVLRNKTLVTHQAMKQVLGSQGNLKDLLL